MKELPHHSKPQTIGAEMIAMRFKGEIKQDAKKKEIMEWISVKERLPSKNGHCLVIKAGYMPYVALFDRFNKLWIDDHSAIVDPTHWAEIPKPPKK